MRETVESFIHRWWTGDNTTHEYILNAEDKIKRDAEYRKMDEDRFNRLNDLLRERTKNPIKCDICSTRDGRDVFFEGLSWFHCPKCGEHGFQSMNVKDLQYECTSCWNLRHFGHR